MAHDAKVLVKCGQLGTGLQSTFAGVLLPEVAKVKEHGRKAAVRSGLQRRRQRTAQLQQARHQRMPLGYLAVEHFAHTFHRQSHQFL